MFRWLTFLIEVKIVRDVGSKRVAACWPRVGDPEVHFRMIGLWRANLCGKQVRTSYFGFLSGKARPGGPRALYVVWKTGWLKTL